MSDACLACACLHTPFEIEAAARPHATAILCGDASLSYGELNRRANQLAHRLRSAGVGPEVLVGLFVDRSLDAVVALLAILKAGGAYLPLDPDNPPARTRFVIEDAKPRVVITESSLVENLGADDADLILLDHFDFASSEGHDNSPPIATPDNLAYVIYTSGSTGQPKGTLITHRNADRLFRTTQCWFDFGRNDVWSVFHSFAFDFSVWELWGALRYGGCAVIVRSDVARSADAFLALIDATRVTVLCQTPSAFYALMDAERSARSRSLRCVIFGGEALEFRRLAPWYERHGDAVQLVNMYGITETTVHATYFPITRDRLDGGSVIGVPLPDLRIHLLDDALAVVAPGSVGEIYVGGPGVARGYLNRPELTDRRFVADPFSPGTASRLYRSGDLARMRADGNLEFCGRIDDQVKLRGYRIELGEIEAALDRCRGVLRSAVILREPRTGDKEVIAYVMAADGADVTPGTLRSTLASTLPAYMMPAAFVAMQSWPLTTNGKLDKAALPPPRREDRLDAPADAPRTETERRLAAIWAAALGADHVGVLDDFFALGAHSLLIARVCAELDEAFAIPLALADVLSSRNVARLAELIDARRANVVRRTATAPSPRGHNDDTPTAFGQDMALYFHELAPGNLAYNNQVTVRLRGNLDPAVLERTLTEIVRRHESLRTTFDRAGGGWRQVVHPPWEVALPVIDDGPNAIRALFEHRFDPGRLPLVRWTLVRHAGGDHTLVHVEHHLIHDGWSFGVFAREFVALYKAYVAGDASPIAELPLQFADFARWQRARDAAGDWNASRAYWQRALAGAATMLDLPTDRPRPPRQTFAGDEIQVELSLPLARSLRAYARSQQCSLFSVMLAGFVAVLHRYSGQRDIIVGAGYANREHKALAPLIGMIVNMLPLRMCAADDTQFGHLVGRTHETARDALPHQQLPFDVIVRSLDLPHDASRNPLCQVAFSCHDSPMPEWRMGEVTGEVSYPHNGSAKFDMNVIVVPHAEQQAGVVAVRRDEQITLKWDFNTALFDRDTVQRMVSSYLRVLAAGLARPASAIGALLAADAEDRRRFAQWNATSRAYPAVSVHALFAQVAAAAPNAVALVAGSETLTYAALDERAERVAQQLRRFGVGVETCVGLCIERSFDMVVAMLGILKAGGAYVPLDPAYPPSRLAFMLADTRAPVLVTTPRLRSQFGDFAGQVLCLDDADDAADAREAQAYIDSRSLAYVMYTSGSTGVPKGVCIEHRSIVRLVRGTSFTRLDAGERVLQFAPISFDASTFEIWGALLNGATLVLCEPGMPSLTALADTLRVQRISTLWLTASLFHQMVDHELDTLARVPQVLAGGESLSLDHVRRMLTAMPPQHVLVNGYGPTEGTTFTCCHAMTDASVLGRSVPIGKPIANTTVHVLDEARRLLPLGVPGELYIGGDGLAREYLNRPELTAERFVHVEGERLYRSGDRARWVVDGTIEFLGRADEQVKLRGFRIEPGEIEAALRQHPAVRESAVLLRAAGSASARLVAYVTANAGATVVGAELRRFAAGWVPEYMVPAEVVAIDALPLTPVGKIDRAALAALKLADADAVVKEKPRTATEHFVAEIWARHVDCKHVGVHDDFFGCGGHSLAAAAMFAEISSRCGAHLPLSVLFEARTIAGLARAIDQRRGGIASAVMIPVQIGGDKPPIFAMLGVGANFAGYAALAEAFGPDQPFYSLEMPGLVDDSLPHGRIDEIVTRLRGELRAMIGGKRCILLGACAGALVVYELARALAEDGHAVDHVIMLDPPPTGAKRTRRMGSYALWRQLALPRFVASRLWLGMRTMRALDGAERRRFLREKLKVAREIVARRDLLRESRHELQFERVQEATSAALLRFAPGEYDGRVTLVVGDRYSLEGEGDVSSDWRVLCRGVFDVARVPGQDTGAMLKSPNLESVTAQLKALLAAH